MTSQVALLLTLCFIGYLLCRDHYQQPRVSTATWIPTLWLMINGSRQVSIWLSQDVSASAQRLEDGSSIDKAVYSALILSGACVLLKRRVNLGAAIRHNAWLWALLLYEGVSVLWSDFPLIALKRWTKALGDPVMVLVLWSDPAPARAITSVLGRCVYVLVPLSVLFCKYYEHLGRTFDMWGNSGYTGVTTDKNMLGYLLFASGLFVMATLMRVRGQARDRRDRWLWWSHVALLYMIGWLFVVANSKTALLSLFAGGVVIVASRWAIVRRHFGVLAFATLLLGVVLEMTFSISGSLAESAGRDATFTGRTGLWHTLLQESVNPLFGVGYASFWLGERLLRYWAMYPMSPPIEAHNGYLEIYINLGIIGLCLLTGVLWSGLVHMKKRITALASSASSHDAVLAVLGIAYGIAYLFYNITEATFQGMNFLFTIFLVLAFTLPTTAAISTGGSARLHGRPVRRGAAGAARPVPVQRASSR